MFWTTFLVLKNVKSLIISYIKIVLENFDFSWLSKTVNLFFFNMLGCCACLGTSELCFCVPFPYFLMDRL